MDAKRSHEVTWSPQPNPPWRYFDHQSKLCLTVQDGYLYKVTCYDETNPIPYVNRSIGGKPSCQREIQVGVNSFMLMDDQEQKEISFHTDWKILPQTDLPAKIPEYPFNWKWFFNGFPPQTDSIKSIYTVPLYPEGNTEIDEPALQPLALDQIIYYMEMAPGMPAKLEKIGRVLIHTFDMSIAGCIDCTQEREYTVLFSDPELAQKNAYQLWDYAAKRKELDNLKKVSFLPEKKHLEEVYNDKYGMIFKWIPMFYFHDRGVCEQILASTVRALLPDGILFLVGPRAIKGLLDHYGLDCLYSDLIMNMPFYRQHLKMCPENLINQDITVFLAEKHRPSDEKKESSLAESTPSFDQKPEPQADLSSEPVIPLRNFDRD